MYFSKSFTALSILLSFISTLRAEEAANEVKTLYVHISPHSHDDPGWLKTVDQYYTGSNASICPASVQYIFDSVVTELLKDKSRHFTFCEISFFSRWYHEQTESRKADFKQLVNDGQIQFVNGGWVMHDEASTHYVSMIDQTTLGHQFLKEELNYIPTVGWQIDPFGHSNTHAWLSSEVGFDSLYFGRIDYQDHNKRMAEKTMEMVWRGSKSDDRAAGVFTGAFSDGNYGPPSGFCFDTTCAYCRSDPVIDDEDLETYNKDEKVASFIQAVLQEHESHVGDHIMLKMGSDFAWDNANSWYKSLDKLIAAVDGKVIEEIEQDQGTGQGQRSSKLRLKVFYSDPVVYTKARAKEGLTWTLKTDDFFPYSDNSDGFWAGYFTSRPTLKFLERTSASFLQVMKQVASLATLTTSTSSRGAFNSASSSSSANSLTMERVQKVAASLTAAVGLINHHDAITGTSKQHVAEDYKKILSKALTSAEELTSEFVSSALNRANTDQTSSPLGFSTCRLFNESICATTQALVPGSSVTIAVYNPLPRTTTQQVSVLLSSNKAVTVVDSNGAAVASDLIPNADFNRAGQSGAPYVLVFTAEAIPALSLAQYTVTMKDASAGIGRSSAESRVSAAILQKQVGSSASSSSEPLVVSSDMISVEFNLQTGRMQRVTRLDHPDVTAEVTNELGYYTSFGSPGLNPNTPPRKPDTRDPHLQNIQPLTDSKNTQYSGAYIFRPAEANEPLHSTADIATPVKLTVVKGEGITEVWQNFSSWASQVVRLRKGSQYVELDWTIGPIPVDDLLGKEVMSRVSSNLKTGGQGANQCYTDSNGREFLQRIYNYRPTYKLEVYEPIAGNFYPLSTSMYVRDEEQKLQLSLFVDRGQAGASLGDGQLESMLHRRLLADDSRGVTEPLNETVGGMTGYPDWERSGDGIIVRGTQRLLLSAADRGIAEVRALMDEFYTPLVPFFAAGSRSGSGSGTPTGTPNDQENSLDSKRKTKTKTLDAKTSTSTMTKSPLAYDLPPNLQLMSLERVSAGKLLVRLAHQFAVDESPKYSVPVTLDLFELLREFKPESAVEVTLSTNQLKTEMLAKKLQWNIWGDNDNNGNKGNKENKDRENKDQVQAEKGMEKGGLRGGSSTSSTSSGSSKGFIVELSPMQIKTFYVRTSTA